MVATSFTFTDEFKKYLDELAKSLGRNRKEVIIDAVNAYRSNSIPDRTYIDLLNQLKAEIAQLKAAIDGNHTLLLAVLKELQTRPDP